MGKKGSFRFWGPCIILLALMAALALSAAAENSNMTRSAQPQRILVHDGGLDREVLTFGETVGDILSRLSIEPGAGTYVSRNLRDQTYDGMELTVTYRTVTRSQEVIEEPFSITYCVDPSLEAGVERTITPGSPARYLRITETTWENGTVISQRVAETRILAPEVPALVARGIDRTAVLHKAEIRGFYRFPDGRTIQTASGDVLTYSRKLSVEATAYSCEGYKGTTATGTTARYGAIAVDPRVIPYGTRMYIVSDDGAYLYGYATAEDCGGGIKGNRIDLYFNTVAECWQFGRRQCTVYILE